MSWLKDNLLFVLAAGCALLGASLLVAVLYYRGEIAIQKANFADVQSEADTLRTTNASNVAALKDTTNRYNQLVLRNALDVAKAAAAADALETYKAQIATANQDNARLRAELARRDKNVQDYLNSGMPHALACQLWPQARDCEN